MAQIKDSVTSAFAGEGVYILNRTQETPAVKQDVQKSCGDLHSGHWYCLTHHEHFENQFMKDTHISKGVHRLVWICHVHGVPEAIE